MIVGATIISLLVKAGESWLSLRNFHKWLIYIIDCFCTLRFGIQGYDLIEYETKRSKVSHCMHQQKIEDLIQLIGKKTSFLSTMRGGCKVLVKKDLKPVK